MQNNYEEIKGRKRTRRDQLKEQKQNKTKQEVVIYLFHIIICPISCLNLLRGLVLHLLGLGGLSP